MPCGLWFEGLHLELKHKMVEDVNSVIVNSVSGLKSLMKTELTMSKRVKCSQSHLSILHYYYVYFGFWVILL